MSRNYVKPAVLCLCLGIGAADLGAQQAPVPPEQSATLRFSEVSVTTNGRPVVNFTVTNENGQGVLLTQEDLADGSLRAGIAKLVPGTNGDADHWQSYINTVEVATPTVGPGGSAALPSALQATMETRNTAGVLTSLGDGRYSYEFATDITDPEQTLGVTFEPGLTHRIVAQVELELATGELVRNPYFDFVPAGGPVARNKKVVKKAACNECHNELAIHGGGRIETEYCVVCHNPGTTDANSGNNLDFAVMVHKIHRGEDLENLPYTIWGFRDSEHDYSTVVYPQDQRNCTKCHSAEKAGTPQGDNWKLQPTREACGGCHDDVDFDNHPTSGAARPDNSLCGECHVPFSSQLDFAIENAHTNFAQETASRFQFNILAVHYLPEGRGVVVDFSVTDPTNNNVPYDIQNDPAFTAGGGASRVAVLIGWDTGDYSNTGSGAAPAQPISLDPLFGGAEAVGGGVFRVSAVLPPEAGGTGVVAIEGHPAVDGVRIPVTNAFEYFAISGPLAPRRQIVSLEKCNACHGNLSLHGNNRQGAIEVCVICHNPDATDIEVRPATVDADGNGEFDDFAAVGVDGKREEAIHFKYMIHAIHAGEAEEHGFRERGIVVYGFRRSVHDYGHVRYPGILSDCNACHVNDSYQVNAPDGSLATTFRTASPALTEQGLIELALADPADDLNVSPESVVCGSCHDSAESLEHIEIVGSGGIGLTQAQIDGSVFENCGGCHGPFEFMDVAEVHRLSR
jgi:OmcA/MtrC family decaheme c-type cytochrome